jgi:hypothetical protein
MMCREAADVIERLAKELAGANRLLEINRRRSREKSGGLEIKQSKDIPAAPIGGAEPVSAREDYEASCGLGFKMPSALAADRSEK